MRVEGIFPVVPTPLTADESVDEASLRRVLRYVIDGGVHGLWMLGSGGEQPMLSAEVQRRALEIAVEEADGRVLVVAGVGAPSLRQALVNLRMAEEAGVDVVQSVEPYYFPYLADELIDYFEALADAARVPLVMYHAPARWPAGSVGPDTLQDTRDFQRVVFALASDDFTILTAAGRLLFSTMMLVLA